MGTEEQGQCQACLVPPSPLCPSPRPQEGPGVSQQRLTHCSLACLPAWAAAVLMMEQMGRWQCGRTGLESLAWLSPPQTATGKRTALWPGHSRGSRDSCGAMHAEGPGRRAGWLGKGKLEMGTGNRRGLPGRGEAFQAIMRANASLWKVLCRDREGGCLGVWGICGGGGKGCW